MTSRKQSSDARVTMRDIAKKAGVSQPAVSMALRNHPSIPPDTCKRIQRLAEKLGYKPNPMVSALMSQLHGKRTADKAPILATLNCWPRSDDAWKKLALNRQFQNGLESRSKELGFELAEFFSQDDGMTAKRLDQILKARGIRGLIVLPLPNQFILPELNWHVYSVSTIGDSVKTPLFHRASHHQYRNMMIILEKLVTRNYQRIAFAITDQLNQRLDQSWLAAYSTYFWSAPTKKQIPPYIGNPPKKIEFSRWIQKHKPDALIASEECFHEWLEHMSVKIPEEMGLATPSYSESARSIGGVKPNRKAVGRTAIDLVVDQINRNEQGIPTLERSIMIEGQWRDGNSLKKESP